MSDLRMYELDDIAWDEFDQIDDHIVPHSSDERGNEAAFQEDRCKKPRHEVIGFSNNDGKSFTKSHNGQEDEGLHSLKRKRTKSLGKAPWLHSAKSNCQAAGDGGSNEETTKLASDRARVSDHCLYTDIETMGTNICADDAVTTSEGCGRDDGNSCPYSLDDISQTENDIKFLDNEREDNGSNDMLYYGWPPDIENFEDVDKMFRSCDSTFGFGSSNEDDLGWLSSSHTIEEPENMLKDFKVSCPEFSPLSIPEHGLSTLNNSSSSVTDTNMGSAYISNESCFQMSEIGEADHPENLSFMDGSAFSDIKRMVMPEDQGVEFGGVCYNNPIASQSNNDNSRMMKLQKKQTNCINLSEGKRKDRYRSRQLFALPDLQKQKKNVAPDSYVYVQAPTTYMHLNYLHPSHQISVGSNPSGIKSEMNSLTSLSPKESSYASNQALSLESSYCHPIGTTMSVHDKQEKLQRRRGIYRSLVPKQVQNSQIGANNNIGAEEVNVTNPADRDCLSVPGASCMSSGFDDISLEASSFRQLQQVMEQLDIRTKLCIRDSLYRLAKSAEQRHRHANMNDFGPSDEIGDTALAEGSNKCSGFMDIETDTNPIDRSVAHLLFHRPSDPSAMPNPDGSFKSHPVVHGSATSPPEPSQVISLGEAATEAEMNAPISNDG